MGEKGVAALFCVVCGGQMGNQVQVEVVMLDSSQEPSVLHGNNNMKSCDICFRTVLYLLWILYLSLFCSYGLELKCILVYPSIIIHETLSGN